MPARAANLALIVAAQVLALSLWFSGTAAGPSMALEATTPSPGFQALLTNAVQAGFVSARWAAPHSPWPTALIHAGSSPLPLWPERRPT